MRTRPLLVVLSLLGPVLMVTPARADEPAPVTNDTRPAITGTAAFRASLTATLGEWTPGGVTTAVSWLRDGRPIDGASDSRYEPVLADIGHRLVVRVTASRPGMTDGVATSAPTAAVTAARFAVKVRPKITGQRRFTRTLTASTGAWSPSPASVRYQWLRNGHVIRASHKKRYTLRVPDVGKHISVRVTARRNGYRTEAAVSRRTSSIKHRVALRRTVTYSVATRGRITADLATFRRLAQQTYDDPRGWRGSGIGFSRVKNGGDFTLVLSQAALVPSFSSECSAQYSCRVGRFVVVNQDRWLFATPVWKRAGRSLRDYRNLVVNHETGHWLGRGHSSCPGPGRRAPVMMQQSKGLHGCRANPWPLRAERFTPRFP